MARCAITVGDRDDMAYDLGLKEESADRGKGQFPETRWSIVLNASAGDERATRALEEICGTYWFPLYVFVRRSGRPAADAEDLTQSFFAKLIEKGYLGQADRGRGRLRSFLLTSLKNFMADEWDKSQAQKRGGGRQPISIDQADAEDRYALEPKDERSPDKLFEKRWALTLLENIIEDLRGEFAASGKEAIFTGLQPFLAWNSAEESYAEVSGRIGISENAARVTVFRMRKRFGELMRERIAETVATGEEVDEEMKFLMGVIAR